MDLDQLRQALRAFEDVAQQRLSIAASAVPAGWPAIAALLRTELQGQTLTVTSIGVFPPAPVTGVEIVYRGVATVLPWSGTGAPAPLAVVLRFTVDPSGEPQLRIDAQPSADWTLDQSFESLAGRSVAAVTWDDVHLLISSTPVSDVAFPALVPAGINLSGTVALAGPFARSGGLLGSPTARVVSGHVSLTAGPIAVLDLGPGLLTSRTVGPQAIDVGARLRTWIRHYPGPSGTDVAYPFDQVAVTGAIRLGATTVLPVRMPLLPDGGALSMELDADAPVPLSGLDDLTGLAGAQLDQVLPAELPAVSGFALRSLALNVDLGTGSGPPERSAIGFDVALTTGGWAILPRDILTLEQLGTRIEVALGSAGPAVSAVVYGRVAVAGVAQLAAELSIPTLDLSISLDDGTTIPVADLMEQFLKRLTDQTYRPPVGGMEVVVLDIVAGLRSGLFQVAAQIDTDWRIGFGSHNGGELVSLGLDDVSFYVDYDGSVLATQFGAVTHIGLAADPARFALSARTAGGPAGWDLDLGLVPGSRIDVLGLLRAFMFPGGETPGQQYHVPTLAITALDAGVRLDPDNAPYELDLAGRVDAAWSFTIFSSTETKLQVAATMELRGTRPLVDGKVPAEAEWTTDGRVAGVVSVFGLDVSVGYAFAADNTALTFGVWYGQRGIEATVSRTVVEEKVTRLLTVRLGDLSLGEILEFLIGLALPGESRRLPAPWDLLYDVDFKDLSLQVDLDTYETTVRYPLVLRLGFMSLESIGLTYVNVGGESQVLLRLEGDFLGQPYGGANGEPLEWDVLGEDAPAVPGKGPKLVEIHYVALGQHVALPVPDAELKTVGAVIDAMKTGMKPVPAGGGSPLDAAASLRYDAGTGWIFGLQATILDTVTLTGVFYDPHLYGAVVELKGERAGSLAGLCAELLYRRINDQIGEFSVDLRVPDALRNFELGAVSVTLGLLHLDVFTNGDFRIDVGFPWKGDFARSFSVQVFPWIGHGGFYFGVLSGATSERVPQIGNGTFDPVIEAGVGLRIGVGKEFHKGPLSAGLTLEAVGIFEGVYAPFHPYDAALAKDSYYWVQGTVGIVGRLYGEVDFFVVKASVSIEIRAQAMLTIEAHAPTSVELTLEVTARASIKVLFITIHFSFELTLDASFTFGSRTPTPWIAAPAPTPGPHAPRALVDGLRAEVAHPLRQQRGLARRPRRALGAAPAMLAVPRRQGRAPWKAAALYGEGTPRTATVQFLPALTVADPEETGTNAVEVVLLLVAENTIAPGARTASEVREVATDHLHETDHHGNPAFAAIIETLLRWAALEGAEATRAGAVTGTQLAAILEDLHDPAFVAATFGYDVLAELLRRSLHLVVRNAPITETTETSGTFVPFVPSLTATATQGSSTETRDYTVVRPVTGRYAENLAAYVEQLTTDALADAASDPLAPPTGSRSAEARAATFGAGGDDDAIPTMAELVFGEGLALLARSAVQAAADHLAALPWPYVGADGPTLRALAASFPSATVRQPVGRTQSLAGVAVAAGLPAHALDAGHPDGLENDAVTASVPVGVTPLSIARDNPGARLAAVAFDVAHLGYQVRAATSSFDGLAAALPQQVTVQDPGGTSGPLSGARIATAVSGEPGLLRAGATITIPAFDYQRLAGDSDAFLAAFFAVRNEGPTGTEHLDWYAQAIATANPNATWAAGTTVDVPTGFQSSATTTPYVVHVGDTLERVAATFARYQSGPPGPPPTTPTYAAGPYAHTIHATDTLDDLVADFPGLALPALVAAVAGADVLAPLTVVTLPAFGVRVTAGQTLAELAGLYDLELADLVALVDDVGGLYEATTLTITRVASRTVDELVTAVAQGAAANAIAAQVSRFLLHGLRVPSPQDTSFTALRPDQVRDGGFADGTLLGLHDAAGLQFAWSAPATVPLELTLSSTATWLTLVDATVEDTGRMIAGDPETTISVTLSDGPPWTGYLPDPTLRLNATAEPLALAATRPVHHELPATIHWQAARQPSLDGSTTPRTAPGEPSLWPLPASLRAAATGTTPTPAFALRGRSLDAPPDSDGADLSRWAWAIHVPFVVHRIPAPPPPGADAGAPWLAGAYAVEGSDATGEDLLFALWTHLQARADAEAGTTLFLLHPPGQAGPASRGLVSDAVDPGDLLLLKTNVSTQTTPPSAGAAAALADGDPTTSFSATLAQPLAFTTLLWEATSVRSGGFTLYDDGSDNALPDGAFDASGRATLTLVCLLGSQVGTTPGRGLLALNTCAVIQDNVDASATQVYAVQTGGVPPRTTAATVPPGHVGIAIARTSPEPPPETPPTAEQRTQLLYNLFGFGSDPEGGFARSNQGLPIGPTGGSDDAWHYQQVVPVATLATSGRTAQASPALPPSARDPYAGVTSCSAIRLRLAAQDAFGNRATALDAPPILDVDVRYTDPLVAVGEYPGLALHHAVVPGTDGPPALTLSLALQATTYLPAPGLGTELALQTASAHALRYERAYWQARRPGVSFGVATTLVPASAADPLPLSPARFAAFAGAAYVFTSQLAGLAPIRHATGPGETLASAAAAYSVTATALLDANAQLDAGDLFATPVVVPRFDRLKHGESLAAFAARHQVEPATLLTTFDNMHAPIAAGTVLAVAERSVPSDGRSTLAELAAAESCAVGDLGTAAASTVGLLADGVVWTLRGLRVTTHDATFTSLVGAFAELGVVTTPAELATANADLPGAFVASTPTDPVSFVVATHVLAAPTTIAALVPAVYPTVDDFLRDSGQTAGIVAPGTTFQLGLDARTAPDGVSVREYAERTLGLSLAQFARANSVPTSGGPALPTLATGAVLLVPALLDPTTLTAGAHAVRGGQSLADVAALYASDAATLGTANQDVGGIFVPGQSIVVGTAAPVITGAEDSLATVLARVRGATTPTLAELIAAVASSATLLRAGAVLIVGAPVVASPSLGGLATALGLDDPVVLGRCNAALDGFLDPAATISLGSTTVTVGRHGTLTSLYARAVDDPATTFDGFLAAVADAPLLRAGARAIVPPPSIAVDAALPAAPGVTATISPLRVDVVVTRPVDEVADGFPTDGDVRIRTSPVPARTGGEPAGYAPYAAGLEAAYAGRLRVAVGQGERGGELHVVRIDPTAKADSNAIRSLELGGDPAYFGLPPLCRELLSRTVDVRTYVPGGDDPLPGPGDPQAFRSVDVQGWAASALALVDLALSPTYVVPAFALTRTPGAGSAPFDRLVGAKETLAGRIAGQATAIVGSGGDAAAAATALRQVLDVSLTAGWETAAVVQIPTTVDAAFAADGEDAGGHRLPVEPVSSALRLDETTTLGGLAGAHHVHVAAVAELLGGTPNLLRADVTLTIPGTTRSWTIGPHDRLQDGADRLDLDLAGLATTFPTVAPLFRAGASVSAGSASATTLAGETLEAVADRLGTSAASVAVANQDVSGLLTGTVYIEGVAYPVTPQTATLAGMARDRDLGVAALAARIAGQAVLATGTTLHVLIPLPDVSISSGKVGLDARTGTVELVVGVADPARYRHLVLDLELAATGLEYGIQPAPLTAAYETSDWLAFVDPLTGDGAPLGTLRSQLDVPLPLRAYPTPPRLVAQQATATLDGGGPGAPSSETAAESSAAAVAERTIAAAKAWTYQATIETQSAAQDELWLTVGWNYAPPASFTFAEATSDPFTALAELTVNQAALQEDLALLLLPPAELAGEANAAQRARAISAFTAVSGLAEQLADAWGPIAPDAGLTSGEVPLEPEATVTVRLETRARTTLSGGQTVETFVLHRAAGATWGPEGRRPQVGYVADDGGFVLLDPQPIAGEGDALLYVVDGDHPLRALERRTIALAYPGLDATVTQNARSSAWLTRNARLVSDQETAEAFVYRTPETHFAAPAAPTLVTAEPIVIGRGALDGLTAAVRSAFVALLGATPEATRTHQTLTVRFGYRLVPEQGDGEPGIEMLSPVVFRPTFAYADEVPGEITAAITAWMQSQPAAPGLDVLVSLELLVLSGVAPTRREPLVTLSRLDYPLTPPSPR